MTTAPDLPTGVPLAVPSPHPAFAPAQRPPLTLVPTQPADADQGFDFDDALRRAGPRLQRYATRRLGDPHEAEEIVQEALLRAFQHRATLATEDDLMAWVTVVTGRLVIDRLRVRGRLTPVAELPPASRSARDTADVVVARDEARIALDALEAMPSRQAAVLWAREVEGLSYDDIGLRFHLSEPSVRSLLHRARRTLRKEYAGRGGTLPAVGLVALAPWLRGLRAAARVREVARRGATAAAVGATGLAIVGVVPFHAPSTPVATPRTSPAIATRADSPAAAVTRPTAVVARSAPTVSGANVASSGRVGGMTFTPMHLPTACAPGGVGAGCATPAGRMIFVRLPVPVAHTTWVGVSSDLLPAGCRPLPSTPLGTCASAPSQEER